jgi:predicted glycosyltransferase involved in capsule biosynthesis
MSRDLYSNVMMFVDMQTCFAKLNKFKTYMQVNGIKNLEVRIEAFGTELGCGVYTNSFASLCIRYDVTTSIRQDDKSL